MDFPPFSNLRKINTEKQTSFKFCILCRELITYEIILPMLSDVLLAFT